MKLFTKCRPLKLSAYICGEMMDKSLIVEAKVKILNINYKC